MIIFSKQCKPITSDELQHVETVLGVQFPLAIKEHYLKVNGGNIKHSVIHTDSGHEIEDVRFIPILYSGDFINEPEFCIPERTRREWANKSIPENLIPLAFVSCGYLCLDHQDGNIYYYRKVGKDKGAVLVANSFKDLMEKIKIKEPDLPEIIMNHPFWGDIIEKWAGFSTTKRFYIPYFEKEDTEIFWGREYDDSGKIDIPPTIAELNDYERTFTDFMQNLDNIMDDIKNETFEYYQKYYAHYFEDEAKYGQKPLNIDTSLKHFEAIKEINYIRVLGENVIQIPIFYGIDTEHGMEIKLKNNKVVDIRGMGEF